MITYIQFQLELGTSHAHGPLLHTGDYLRDHVIIRLADLHYHYHYIKLLL